MSFLAKSPQLPQTTGQDGPMFSTYKEGDAVPMGYGREFYVSHWLSDKYDVHGAYGGQGKPEWQYCSIAAEYRPGPIDFVGKVKRDGKVIANFAYDFAPGEESHEFTLNPALASGRAWKAIVHRGTADAPLSIVANLNAHTGQNHPPYRNRAWIEWINIDLGQGVSALPDLQVEMGVNAPAVGAFPGGASHPYGVNPFAAIYGILRSPHGYNLDASLFDDADWAAQCAALEATGIADRTGALVHCHPIFKTAQEASALLSTILAHTDGFLYIHDGKFRIGWFPSQAPNIAALPEITEHDIESKPTGAEFPDWNRGASSVVVLYRDFDRDYQETPALCPAPSNQETGVSSVPARTERPMIHAADQARMIAAEISASRGSNESTMTLPVQKSRAVKGDGTPLLPGDLFVWDYGPHALDLVVRVIGRRFRHGQSTDLIEIIPERGQFPLPYVPPVEPRALPEPSAPGEITPADVRLWLLPSGLSTLRKVAPLVNRAHRGIYRVDLHMSTAGLSPWSVILDSRFFAAKCSVVNGGITAASAVVRVTSTSVDFARMQSRDAVAQADDALCVLIGNELCSVGAVTVVAPNVYDLAILRGRRETTAAAHADGETAWLFLRDELMSIEHAEFYRVRDGSNVYNAAIATKYFKFQLFTIDEDGLAKPDDPGIAFQLPDLSADESTGYTVTLSNEAHTVACDKDGNVIGGQLGLGSLAKTLVTVLRGGTPLTAVAAGPNSDQFAIGALITSNTAATKEANDTVRCDNLTADTGTIQISINVAGAFTITKTFTLTKVKTGATGAAGAAGATGGPGPGLVYMGAYNAATVYYHTAARRDVVSVGGNYYLANNAAKSGTATWGAPGGADWTAPDASYKFVATALLLAEDATITRTLVMGDGSTLNGGLIRSVGATAFNAGAGYWLNPRNAGGNAEFRIGNPAGSYLSYDGTRVAAKFGTGATPTTIDDNGILFGELSSSYSRLGATASSPYLHLSRFAGGAAFLGADANGGYLSLQSTSGNQVLGWDGSVEMLKFAGDAGAGWYRPAAATLKTNGHLELGGNLKTAGDIYLGTGGANRWLYDGSGNRILQQRYGAASDPGFATDLATALDRVNWCADVILHHGLGA